MTALISAEFLKLRTIRSPWLLLLAAQLVVIAGVSGLMVNGGDVHLASTQAAAVRHAGLVSLFSLILGIMAVALEYRHKTITDAFLATPRRGQVIGSKLVVYSLVGLLFGLISAVVAVIAAAIWLTAKGTSLDLSSGELWRTLIGSVIWNATFAALGVGLGALVRNMAGAIAAALAWSALIEGVVGQLIGSFSRWLPVASGSTVVGMRSSSSSLPQWGAALMLVAYAGLFAVLAIVVTTRRDVT